MKLTVIALCLTAFQSLGLITLGQDARISLKMENVSIKQVLNSIEDQTNFFFIYNGKLVNVERKVNVLVNNQNIKDVLLKIFAGTNIKYEIDNRQILLLNVNEAEGSHSQQQKTISGKVSDSSGGPLPGVSVVLKGTTSGTITGTDGTFTITVPSEKSILVFSFIGMNSQEITVGDQTHVLIKLTEQTIGLDEVVAIGYGTTTKRATTAAISSIKTNNLVNLPSSSVAEVLGGRSAGLIVSNSGGGLGTRPTISIRGATYMKIKDDGTLEQTVANPILIIDGVMTTDIDQLHRMNPRDIESFTILKDAEAVAVYGSKGGNGAIVITTKHGEKGQIQINYGYRMNFSQPTIQPQKLSSYEMVTLRNQAADFSGQPRPYSDEVVQKYKDQSDPFNYPNTNWQKLALKDFAKEYKHDLSLTGGTDKMYYYASLSYFDQGSLYKVNSNWLKRYTYRMSITNNFDKIGLKTTLSFFGDVEKTRAPYSSRGTSYGEIWGHIQDRYPMELAYTDLGLLSTQNDHPLMEMSTESGYNKNDNRNTNGQLDLEWNVPKVKGLKLKLMSYFRNDNYFQKLWRTSANQYLLGSDVPVEKIKPTLQLKAAAGWRYRIQPFITYEQTFKKHSINVKFGYDESYSYWHDVNASRENYILSVDQIFAGPTETAKNNGTENEEANAGFVGILDYSFDRKYMIGGSIRYDGNDKFPSGKRWGTFYSGSVGWVVTEENFARVLKENLKMDFLKLRFSYGETGLDDGVRRYEYLPGYSLVERAYVVDGKIVPGFDEGALVSRDITWYQRKSVNTGIDFALFNNKLSGSADYFFYKTTNFLWTPSGSIYSDPLGTSLPKVNTNGEQRRAGWEFELKYRNQIGELFYEIGANATHFDELWVNKFDESEDQLKNPRTREAHQVSIGKRTYISEGFYQSDNDVMNSPKRNNSYDIVAGDLKYRDVNGDGQIDSEDLVRSGKPSFPRLMYGITIDLRYKAWSAGMLFQGTGNRNIYLENKTRNTSVLDILYPFQTNFWMPDNRNATYPRIVPTESFNGNNNQVDSDFWLVNARYFRLKSLQVSYDLKHKLIKNLPVSNCSLFLSGTNLFTVSKLFRKYKMDPETNSANNYGYPLQRVFSLGLNVGF